MAEIENDANVTNRSKPKEVATASSENLVELVGKVSSVGRFAYTPAGTATLEILLAVAQSSFGRKSMGNFPVSLQGSLAESWKPKLRIGVRIRVLGNIWGRNFKNRWGESQIEIKVIAKELTVN